MGSPGLRLIFPQRSLRHHSHAVIGGIVSNSDKYLDPKDYVSPGDPGYDRQVLRVSRQITFTTTVPITSYPDMDVPGAIEYERELNLAEIIESLQFIDTHVDHRAHIEVHQVPVGESSE